MSCARDDLPLIPSLERQMVVILCCRRVDTVIRALKRDTRNLYDGLCCQLCLNGIQGWIAMQLGLGPI